MIPQWIDLTPEEEAEFDRISGLTGNTYGDESREEGEHMASPASTGDTPPPQSGARTVHAPGPLKKKPMARPTAKKPVPKTSAPKRKK